MPDASLRQLINDTPYHSYLYAYPHKTAYRPFAQPQDLKTIWQEENTSNLYLYIHIPFCNMRCGFCNLFTLAQPRGDIAQRYVQQLLRQMQVTSNFLEQPRFTGFACGGGTPTFLAADELALIFGSANKFLGLEMNTISSGIETSPETATTDRLQVCKDFGIERISMGLQSFYYAEVQALARKQKWQDVDAAIHRIRQSNIPILNLDLIYGIPGQTVQTFLDTLEATLRYAPEELYLYPLYVRPLTGLQKIRANAHKHFDEKNTQLLQQHQHAQDLRLEMYCVARDYLLEKGYQQVSMRMFQLKEANHANSSNVIRKQGNYSCQNDGMIGLGCGARSYTKALHYSEEYGIARNRISDIINSYCTRPPNDFTTARYGYLLTLQEQQRRFVIQSLLLCSGLTLSDYTKRFNSSCMVDLPQLQELVDLGLATINTEKLMLTTEGMSYADTIGPWLISSEVQQKMQDYDLK